ncbi:hypothetical protein GCM10010193_56990 [Kitasatospora atroaurantiaca]|uniref:Uncharacterized protein n=1 Tax=Kitasatospora atroaurantiaca TaxID=285545 RepID=A0A561EMU8_9ACTN|nr:hypothetical protein [Kitasatospora atroaurantiaca]TWE16948.1 hypothetical protein FB465_1943 [Kitasatospora atroaurantiaca]
MNLAPIPTGRIHDPTWRLVHDRYDRLITPLRARGYVVDIKNAAKASRRITAALPDRSRLTITAGTGLPLRAENVISWLVQHEPKGELATVLVYDSTPSGLAHAAQSILSPLLIEVDEYLARSGIAEAPPAGHPVSVFTSEAADARFGATEHLGQYADSSAAVLAHQQHQDSLSRAGWVRLWTHPSADWPRSLWSRNAKVLHTWIDLAELNRPRPTEPATQAAHDVAEVAP